MNIGLHNLNNSSHDHNQRDIVFNQTSCHFPGDNTIRRQHYIREN